MSVSGIKRPDGAKRSGNNEILLTPGPLTTSLATKEAMLRDWGSRDKAFIALNARIRARLTEIAGGGEDYECVPVQGSGTFAIEATLGTLLPRDGKLLVVVNGAYGKRMVSITQRMGRACTALEYAENQVPSLDDINAQLDADSAITHIAVVHCETTSGILNPIEAIAKLAATRNKLLIIDTMSAFGAISVDVRALGCLAVVASSNKCLEGVPGVGYAIIKRDELQQCEGNAHALSLDLYDQWRAMQGNGQWRFTPPTHVLAAFDQALKEHAAEGGVAGRYARYAKLCKTLVDGMRKLGFETLLADEVQAPIIVTFRMPRDANFDFQQFYDALAGIGYVIYPGKLTVAPSFRIGCIGQIDEQDMNDALATIAATLNDMGVKNGAP